MSKKHLTELMQRYPAIGDLQQKALRKMPHIAREYLESGTGDERGVLRNIERLAAVTLVPQLLKGELQPEVATTLFGQRYQAPFGIAPIGLSGLMWPRSECILAATAAKYGIPYCLSTVATQTPETIGPIAGAMGWFQLYSPRALDVRRDLLQRAKDAGFTTLVVTVDTPMPSRRERVTRAGLRMPPRITSRFVYEALCHPQWTFHTLKAGLPKLRIIEKYARSANMATTAAFVGQQIGGTLSWDYLKEVRDQWRGPLVAKGIHHPQDAEAAIEIGVDGIQVSNHGARQFDGVPAAIDLLPPIVHQVNGRVPILFDSGVCSGLDIVRALALGADFVFLGRAFIYGVAALGKHGGDHVVEILLEDLENNMVQLGYATLEEIAVDAAAD
ncbi:MAG: alpha-hydroxy acid oxidase [Candidatus Latescibacterota bacterium]|nr:alpha-hydroxy acid oxidase [Candidatus Latescibacterota bacterium]